jgi:hypothetical protein
MALIRPNAEPPVTAVASGDTFLIDGSTGVRALAATSVALRDANGNVALNNVVEGFASTATAGGTTTLTVASASQQFFTGTAAQTVVLPVVSTLQEGQGYFFQNSSTGSLTVDSSGGNVVKVIGPGAFAIVTCISLTGTTAASWQASYFGDIVVSGRVLTVQNSLTLAGTDGTVVTFPATSATIARTDAGQTFTGTQVFGALTATSLNGNVLTAGTGTLTLAAGKTLTANNTLTLAGTDGTTQTFPVTSATLARTDAGQTFTGTNAFGVLTATSLNGNTITTGTGTLTLAAGKTLTVSNSLTLAGTDGTTQTFPTTSGTVVTSVSSNVVTNAMRAQMAAWTLKGNATAALANEADIDVTALTAKASPVSADIVLIQDSAASNAFKKTTVGAIASAGVSGVSSLNGLTGAVTIPLAFGGGRLTLASGVGATTTDIAGAATIYFTPGGITALPVYNGTIWQSYITSEISLALDSTSSDTGYHASGSIFDLFAINNAGTIQLVTGPAWTSSTARGTGTGTTQLQNLNGTFVNQNAMTARFGSSSGNTVSVPATQATYLGSFQATANGQASDTRLNRLLYNFYVPAKRSLFASDPTASWAYSNGSTWRPADGNTANAVTVLAGLQGIVVDLNGAQTVYGTAAGQTVGAGIGVNSTTLPDGGSTLAVTVGGTNFYTPLRTPKTHAPALGATTYTLLELGAGSGTQTWLGAGLTYLIGSVLM